MTAKHYFTISIVYKATLESLVQTKTETEKAKKCRKIRESASETEKKKKGDAI